MPPLVISFDGLHRSGKGTQISLLEKELSNVRIMRGDGSRKGIGDTNDPYSSWWQQQQQLLRITKEYDSEPWNEATNKLNQEIHEAYQTNKHDYLLLDRSAISSYILKKDNALYFTNKEGEKTAIVKPDVAFVIHVPKEELLRRNDIVSDHPEKYEFRKQNIEKNYEAFEKMSYKIQLPGTNIIHLDGEQTPKSIFQQVLQECNNNGVI